MIQFADRALRRFSIGISPQSCRIAFHIPAQPRAVSYPAEVDGLCVAAALGKAFVMSQTYRLGHTGGRLVFSLLLLVVPLVCVCMCGVNQ